MEFTMTKDDNLLSDKKISSFQLPRSNSGSDKDQQQQQQELFMAMMNRGEEDLLNPLEQNNNFLHVDNSQIILNDPMRNSTNSINGNTSTTRSMVKPMINNDDTISCSSEAGYNEGNNSFKIQSTKKMENSEMKGLAQIPNDLNTTKSRAEWYHTQGFEARKRGEFPLAIEYYSKALEIYPNHFKVNFVISCKSILMVYSTCPNHIKIRRKILKTE